MAFRRHVDSGCARVSELIIIVIVEGRPSALLRGRQSDRLCEEAEQEQEIGDHRFSPL